MLANYNRVQKWDEVYRDWIFSFVTKSNAILASFLFRSKCWATSMTSNCHSHYKLLGRIPQYTQTALASTVNLQWQHLNSERHRQQTHWEITKQHDRQNSPTNDHPSSAVACPSKSGQSPVSAIARWHLCPWLHPNSQQGMCCTDPAAPPYLARMPFSAYVLFPIAIMRKKKKKSLINSNTPLASHVFEL